MGIYLLICLSIISLCMAISVFIMYRTIKNVLSPHQFIRLEHTISMLACMIAVGHPDPRFRLWGIIHLEDYWKSEFFFEMDGAKAEGQLRRLHNYKDYLRTMAAINQEKRALGEIEEPVLNERQWVGSNG